jgi:uncharacterized membrane protein YdjX (TVP38/TMEM64 family)
MAQGQAGRRQVTRTSLADKLSWPRIFLILLFAAAIVAFFVLDVPSYLSLSKIKAQRTMIVDYRMAHPAQALLIFYVVYASYVGLSLPGGTVFTIIAGAVFDFWAVVIASFALNTGNVLAFLSSRFVMRDFIYRRKSLQPRIRKIDEGVKREGALFLFSTRVIPGFPYTIVNIAMGLTTMPVLQFAWVSQIGNLANIFIYTNAGSNIAEIETFTDIFSGRLILSLVAMACIPIIVQLLMARRRKLRKA